MTLSVHGHPARTRRRVGGWVLLVWILLPVLLHAQEARIELAAPQDLDVYESSIELRGTVTAAPGAIVHWEVVGSRLSGRTETDTLGRFSVRIPPPSSRVGALVRVSVWLDGTRVAGTSVAVVREQPGDPVLVLHEPEDGHVYSDSLRIRGTVEGGGTPLPRVGWRISDSSLQGVLRPGQDGVFDADIATGGLHGDRELTVTAYSRTGRSPGTTVGLRDEGEAPLVGILEPHDGSLYTDFVTLAGQITGRGDILLTDAVERAEWRLADGEIWQPLDLGTLGTYRVSVDLSDSQGSVVMEVRAFAPNGKQAIASVAIERDDAVLVLHLEDPSDQASYGERIEIAGSVGMHGSRGYAPGGADGVLAGVVGEDLNVQLAVDPATGRYSGSIPTDGLSGVKTLRVSVRDAQGRELATTRTLIPSQDDLTPPPGESLRIALSAPGPTELYTDMLRVEGRILGTTAGDAVRSIDWELVDTMVGGTEIPEEDQSFAFEIPMMGLHGPQALVVSLRVAQTILARHTVVLGDGNVEPVVSIDRPASDTEYGAYVVVRGTVGFPEEAVISTGDEDAITAVRCTVASAAYDFTRAPVEVDVVLDPSGKYLAILPTGELEGAQRVTVFATAWNGNIGQASVEIIRGASDLPGFSVSAGDGRITATWDELPYAAHISLLWEPGRIEQFSTPGVENPVSPFTIANAVNGRVYSLRLDVTTAEGEQLSSALQRAIPLAQDTITPQVDGEYQQIRVSWQSLPDVDGYDVYREEEGQDPRRVATVSGESHFVDTTVEYGRRYGYRIKPTDHAEVLSNPVWAESLAFPTERLDISGSQPASDIGRIVIDGSYAYMASGIEGLVIADVHDPSAPARISSLPLENARSVAVATLEFGRRYAFVADGARGVRVIDVSVPAEPELVGSRVTSDAWDVAVSSDNTDAWYVYVADGERGIKIVDVTSPRRPTRVATIEIGSARAVELHQGMLYVGGDTGITILDASDPLDLEELARLPARDVRAISVSGLSGETIVYAATGESGVLVVRATDPRTPQIVSTFDTAMAVDVATHPALDELGFVLAADSEEGLLILDASDPEHPRRVESLRVVGSIRAIAVGELVYGRRYALIGDDEGLKIIRILVEGRSLELASASMPGKGYGVSIHQVGTEAYAFVPDHQRGVMAFGLAEAASSVASVSQTTVPTTYAHDAVVLGAEGETERLYVADGSGGVKIFELGEQPRLAGEAYASDARAISVYRTAEGSIIGAVADLRDGLRVIEITDPTRGRVIATVGGFRARDVAVIRTSGGETLAFIAAEDGLGVVRISGTEEAQLVGRLEGYRLRSIAVLPALGAAVAVSERGVEVFDVRDPASPRLAGFYESAFAEDVAVPEGGMLVYVAEGHEGMSVLDLTTLDRPRKVSACTTVYATGVAAIDTEDGERYAYVTGASHLRKIHVLIPAWLR